jgi:flagellar assembly protein FliH
VGIIKKDKFEEKGTLYLEEGRVELSKARREEIPQEVEISPEELPMLGPVQDKAERIIANAESRAQGIIENARDEIDRMKEESRELGFEEGKREAMEQVSHQFSDTMETVNQAVIARRKIIEDSEGEILRLALKVAEQIIRSEVSLHRDVCLNIVSEAISRVSDREQIIIKVNRDDVEQIKKYKDRIAGIVDGVKSFSILEDSHVESGGCIIETNLGYVDARISTKLKSIAESFKKVRESAEES